MNILLAVLLKFRENRIGIVGDIKKGTTLSISKNLNNTYIVSSGEIWRLIVTQTFKL